MKKMYFHWKALALSLLFIPAFLSAQDYNNIHRFSRNYERSAHTCATQLRSGKIVEGGTISNPFILGSKVVELGFVDPFAGTLTPHPLTYAYQGLDHTAADLVESLGDPGYVVCAANLGSSRVDVNTIINVFKTDPSTGVVLWSRVYKSGNGSQVASAMCDDNEKSYYVIGQASFGGTNFMYVIKIKDDATPLWERYYFTGSRTDMLSGVDVIVDREAVVVTGNLSTSVVDPSERGIIIAKLNPADGSVIDARHLTHLNGNQNIKVRDLELVNGNYVIVGEYNRNPIGTFGPRLGFMVSYNSALTVTATRVYGDAEGNDVIATGVKPGRYFGNMYISFDLGTGARASYLPGIIHANSVGTLITSEIFKLEGYLGSNGLIDVNGLRSYMIKGSTSFASLPGAPSLSLIGQSVPLADNDATCARIYELKDQAVRYNSVALKLDVERVETVDKIELIVNRIDGRTVDCNGTVIGSFKLAAPAKIEENSNDNVASNFEIYPNPSNGQFTIRFTEGETAAYQTGEVFNLMGEVVATFNINSTVNNVDLSGQASGIYLLRMKSSDGNVSDARRITIK